MCLDTTETAGIPEPLSSPAGGQKCTPVYRCTCVYLCVIVHVSLLNSQVRRAPSACTMFD